MLYILSRLLSFLGKESVHTHYYNSEKSMGNKPLKSDSNDSEQSVCGHVTLELPSAMLEDHFLVTSLVFSLCLPS